MVRRSSAVDVTCVPSSGSTFAVGDTTVRCEAHDAAGNAASQTFTVHVKNVTEQIGDLSSAITASTLPPQTATSAVKLLDDATAALAAGKKTAACGKLGAVVNKIRAKSGKEITADDAAAIIGDLDRIRAVAGC
jgi:HYR domain